MTEAHPGRSHAPTAYFSPEFGVAASIPQYSGGLGILAGDHMKAASDLDVPVQGVGLFYREGFFRQDVVAGQQRERYETQTPEAHGFTLVGTVTVPVDGRAVAANVWDMPVGRRSILLLDTDHPDNTAADRRITDRLYSGDRRHRLDQELVLGVGGVRALRAAGRDVTGYHLNEGHACFLLLELLREQVAAGADLPTAKAWVSARSLFTTHTPVPAGIDRFHHDLVGPELAPWALELGVTVAELLAWAHLPADEPLQFNTAALCLHLSGRSNGVSELHGAVSRELFASLPGGADIGSITNGVHARSWVSPRRQAQFDHHLGAGWADGDPDAWTRVDAITDAELAAERAGAAVGLADLVRDRTGVTLTDGALTIGFARRFATYKRAALLLRDPDRLAALLADDDRPVQFVFAGKAHPADTDGKAVLAAVTEFAASPEANGRFVLVPDYDIGVATTMYAACDVWLNNPLRPYEACGTSGEKSALNGGLNCSILDGWWAEWYSPDAGWAIPSSALADPDARDDQEAAALHDLLQDAVVPLFFDGGAPGPAWWARVRSMWRHLGPRITASRMVRDYERLYAQLG